MRTRLMFQFAVAIAIVCTAPLAAVALWGGNAAEKDVKAIQGVWKVVKMEENGEKAPAEITAQLKLIFKGEKLTFTPGEPGYTNFTFKLDPTAKPASFDMTHVDGRNKDETKQGIYSLQENTLRICFGKTNERPKEFTSNGQVIYVVERMEDIEKKSLDGVWVVESLLRDPREKNPDEGKGIRCVVNGSTVVAKLPGNDNPAGTLFIKIDSTVTPKAIDMRPQGEKETVHAIYELDGDTLTVCWGPLGKERPTALASKPGSGQSLVKLKREKR